MTQGILVGVKRTNVFYKRKKNLKQQASFLKILQLILQKKWIWMKVFHILDVLNNQSDRIIIVQIHNEHLCQNRLINIHLKKQQQHLHNNG